ncbi:MAG: tRNA pseudouridine(13) synthase TruD [Verrucomicrobiota bacterium]
MGKEFPPNRWVHGGPLGSVRFKSVPEDFFVEEILGFEPSGVGEHCLVLVEKRDLDSNVATTRLADALGIRRRMISHCGLKDRRAVTRQWFSIQLPGQPSPEARALESDGLRVLRVTRNTRKLRRGIHVGNRFTIRLRDPDFEPEKALCRWQSITRDGAANLFGPQRFGRDGRNVEKAISFFRGEIETRDRLFRGLLLSAARSALFNACVSERLDRGQWDVPLVGEVYGFPDNRTILLPDRQRGDEVERFDKGQVELTAPLWGLGDLQTVGKVKELETEVAARYPEITGGLEACGLRQERRVLRLRPLHSKLEILANGDLQLGFDLPRGAYATVLLRELVRWEEDAEW